MSVAERSRELHWDLNTHSCTLEKKRSQGSSEVGRALSCTRGSLRGQGAPGGAQAAYLHMPLFLTRSSDRKVSG